MRNFLCSFLLIVFSHSTQAVQIKSFTEPHMLSFTVSSQELTHIIVKNDRIQTVRGNEGAYLINVDSQRGTLYIKPTPAYQSLPFSIFLSTEQGRTIPLLLKPAQTPSDTLIIQPRTPSPDLYHKEKAEPYTQTLIQLIQAMARNKEDKFVTLKEPTKIAIGQSLLEVMRVKRYSTAQLDGEVFILTNHSSKTQLVPIATFILPLTAVLAWQSTLLLPGQSQALYRVSRHEQ